MLVEKLITIIKPLIKKLIPPVCRLRLRAMFSPMCQKGKGSYIAPRVQLLGAANIKLGDNTCISEDSWLNVNHRDTGKIAIQIGNHCFIGRRNFFSSGDKIILGDYILTTNDCRFICSSHNIDNPTVPYMTTGTTSTDSIVVGHNCFFGAGSTVIGDLTIGHGSIVGAGALLTTSIPPFSIAIGNPAKIVKRYSFSKKKWLAVEALDKNDLSDNPGEDEYLSMLKTQCTDINMPLVAASTTFGNI